MKKALSSHPTLAVLVFLLVLGALAAVWLVRPFAKPAAQTTPVPSPTAQASVVPGILDRPVVSNPPTQIEEGNLLFWGVCMACHGNEGQGLTDQWREDAFGEDKDCWVSRCHASNHPPQGFEFPHTIPAIVGGGTLGRFASARQVYDYVVAMMPWWDAGSLTPEKGWQVTAYLLELNGTLPGQMYLDGKVASAIPVHRKLQVPGDDTNFALAFAGALTLAMAAFLLREARAVRPILVRQGLEPDAARKRTPRRPSFIAHLHPPSIPALQARWRYTLGAGGLAVFLCLVLLATGLLEMFYYIPTPEQAAVTVETIHFFVPLGAFVRNLHYWAAQLLVVVSAVHLLRVVFTGAYASRRRFNYLLGLIMFVFVLLLDFTGYVLRWDEGIRWALTAGTNLLYAIPWAGTAIYKFVVGGVQAGPATLIRFYAWHIFALSAGAGIVLIWHLFRVRRDGGIAAPPPAPGGGSPARIARGQLVSREVLAIFLGSILLVLLAAYASAPLSEPLQGSPNLSTDTRAPWFFLWVQQLLKLGDPFLLGVLLPVGVILLAAALPYLLPGPVQPELGRWFPRSGRIIQIIIGLLAFAILILTLLALLPAANG